MQQKKMTRLKYLVDIHTEHAETNEGYIGLENVESWSGRKIITDTPEAEGVTLSYQKDDVLFGKLRPYLAKCYVAKDDGCCSTEFLVLRPKGAISKYLQYRILSLDFIDKVNMSTYGAKMPRANWSFIGNMKLVLPSLDKQQSIADYLDDRCAKIDAIIAEAKASIEEYKELKQAVITNAVTKGLNKKAELKNSHRMWIGEIPVHWEVAELKFFASIKAGITLGKKYPAEAKLIEMPYLRVANVQGDYVDLSDVKTIAVLPEEVEKYRLEPEVVLMTEGGDRDKLARGCVWHGEIDPCLHQNHVFALTTDQEKLNPDFFSYVTTSDVARVYFDYTAKKTTNLANTNATTIMNFRLAIPPLKEQKEIVECLNSYIHNFDGLISEKQSLIEDLESYKKSLIYEVVTGKRKVVD